MNATILLGTIKVVEMTSTISYIIGAVIALFIFGYLFYSLVKPEKF